MRLVRLLSPLLALVLLPMATVAQSVDTAGLEVDVHDPGGALIPGATLTLTQTETHDIRTGVTDGHGRFRFAELPVGSYELIATKNGFGEIKQTGITLSIGQASTLNLDMAVASAETVVQVNSDVSTVDPDRTTIGQTISSVEIENLPSDGRSFLDFAVTVPGVTATATTGQNSGFSVNGQRSRSNSIMIDGVENNGDFNGNVRLTLSQDAIAQFQVLTEQFPAEYGGAGGGFINVVTKGGTDQFHGTAYYFNRNQWLNTPNHFATATPGNYNRNDLGTAFGGPLKSGRTFFYGSIEYIGVNTSSGQSSTFLADAAQVNATLATGAFKGSPITSLSTAQYVPQSSALMLSSVRVDHRIGDRDTLIGRVLYDQYIQGSNIDAGGPYDVSASDGTYTHTQNYFAEETHVFSPTLIDETHLMVAPQRLKQLPHSSGPGANLDGVVEFGPTADFPVTLNEDHYEADNAITWTHGAHLFKAGYQLNYIRAESNFPTSFAGQWNFFSTTHFYQNAPDTFTQSFGNPDVKLPDTLMGAYAEDSWKATSRLTVNLGVRYDLDLQPQGLNLNNADPIQANLSKGMPRDYNNFAPRIGLAYSIDKRGKTILRAGYGLFYDKNLLILARNTLESIETLTLNNSTPTTAVAQYLHGPLPESASYPTGIGRAPSVNRAFPGLVIPFTHQVDFGIDRAITSNMIFSATYVHVTGEKLLKEYNSNLGPPVILTTANQVALGFSAPVVQTTPTAYYTCSPTLTAPTTSPATTQPAFQQCNRPYYSNSDRLNSSFNDIDIVGPWGHSNYNGLRATLTQQAKWGLTFRFGWVWSRAEDDAADFVNGNYANNPYDPHAEKSLSNEDVRNRFTSAIVYRLTVRSRHEAIRLAFSNWVFGATMTGGSGTPENITVGQDMNNDDAFSDRPFINGVMVGRNTFRGGRQSSVALRGQKEFRLFHGNRLTFSAEAFNAFNHSNYTSYETIWGTLQNHGSSFGQPVAAGSARDMQLGVRYTF